MNIKVVENAERGGYTAHSLVLPEANAGSSLKESEFFRLPRPGTRCPLSGLSRTSILEYGESGNFKMIRLRKRGSKRGIVLVETASFLKWLHCQPTVSGKE